jgi:hypothetical protein
MKPGSRFVLISLLGLSTLGLGLLSLAELGDQQKVDVASVNHGQPDALTQRPDILMTRAPATTAKAVKAVVSSHRQRTSRSANKTKSRPAVIDHGFELENLPGQPYKLVNNFKAIFATEENRRFIQGYELVESQDSAELNIVYDQKLQRYGVWTREIIVQGEEAALNALQSKLNLERIQEGHVNIFRVPDDLNLQQLISGWDSSLQLEFDISYARVKNHSMRRTGK